MSGKLTGLLCYVLRRLTNGGKDPVDGHDLVLVLRDSAARTQLPALRKWRLSSLRYGLLSPREKASSPADLALSFLTDCTPEPPLEALQQPRHLEIIGGSHHPPHASAPLVFPGTEVL